MTQGNIKKKEQSLEEKAKFLGIPFIEEIPGKIGREVVTSIPEETAKRYQMAVFEKDDSSMKVAMIDPHNFQALNVLRFISEKENKEIKIYLTSGNILEKILDEYSSTEKAVEAVVDSFKSKEERETLVDTDKDIKEIIQDAPVSKLVQVVIDHAIDGKASDIHIEPIDDEYRIRFRVDGILHSSLVLPNAVGKAIVSRVKILSNLKIDEKRKPQDGRFKTTVENGEVDFRISTFPVVDGEKVVMRVLNKETGLLDLDQLGLMGRNKKVMGREIRNTNGIVLMTGPTGSGKSTTLYAFLGIINKEERNIVTLEDPVEYSIDGINQSQIKPEIGYDFASGLRSILRQDPNVIMVGEIRDSETAELAIHAALTGHLVFSTLHTNSALGALPRLIDMGIEPFLITSSVNMLAAQRLVRRVCDNCKKEVKVPSNVVEKINAEISNVSKEEIEAYGLDLTQGLKFYEGQGCEKCGKTGLKGRMAIYECIEIDEKIKEDLSESTEIKLVDVVKRQGVITMKQDGFLKVLKGITTIAEVERVTEGSLTIGGDVDDDRG